MKIESPIKRRVSRQIFVGTVPVGGGFGRIVKWGKQPLDLSASAYYNVEKPIPEIAQGPNVDNQGESWTLRLQFQLMFPK